MSKPLLLGRRDYCPPRLRRGSSSPPSRVFSSRCLRFDLTVSRDKARPRNTFGRLLTVRFVRRDTCTNIRRPCASSVARMPCIALQGSNCRAIRRYVVCVLQDARTWALLLSRERCDRCVSRRYNISRYYRKRTRVWPRSATSSAGHLAPYLACIRRYNDARAYSDLETGRNALETTALKRAILRFR